MALRSSRGYETASSRLLMRWRCAGLVQGGPRLETVVFLLRTSPPPHPPAHKPRGSVVASDALVFAPAAMVFVAAALVLALAGYWLANFTAGRA